MTKIIKNKIRILFPKHIVLKWICMFVTVVLRASELLPTLLKSHSRLLITITHFCLKYQNILNSKNPCRQQKTADTLSLKF